MQIEQELEITDGYVQFTGDGLWNGTGDFRLSFTGEIYLYMLVLSTDKVESLKYRYQTLFEQSEKLIQIAATNFDSDGNPLQSSQIVTKAEMNLIVSGINSQFNNIDKTAADIIRQINGVIGTINGIDSAISGIAGKISDINIAMAGFVTTSSLAGMFVIGADGNICSIVGANADGVYIKASAIKLEGLVTANQNFKILEGGSIEAVNASIKGRFESNVSGNKIIIDPNERAIMLCADTTVLGKISFENGYGCIRLGSEMFLSGSTLNFSSDDGGSSVSKGGFSVYDGNNSLFQAIMNLGALRLVAKGIPTNSAGLNSGEIWRDGNNLKIV
jgi:hypothetical protein